MEENKKYNPKIIGGQIFKTKTIPDSYCVKYYVWVGESGQAYITTLMLIPGQPDKNWEKVCWHIVGTKFGKTLYSKWNVFQLTSLNAIYKIVLDSLSEHNSKKDN